MSDEGIRRTMSSRPALKAVYGIWGEDRGKVQRATTRLRDRVASEGGMPSDLFDAGVDSAADVAAACETLSFGGTRLVIVANADAWRADDATVLVQYLAAPNPNTCLALVGEGPVTPKLLAAIEQAGETLHFGPDPKLKRGERPKWFAQHVVSECERAGGKIAIGLARTVVERVGEDAMTLTQEAFKLARAAGQTPVDKALVDALVVAHPDAKTYELADALTAGQGRRVFDLLDELSVGDNPSEPIVIQSGLARHFRTIAAAQALGTRASAERLGELTGVKGYPATKAIEQARSLPEGVGARCVACLAALELDLRVSSLSQLGRSSDDGRRFVLERAARELLEITKQ